MAGPTLNQGEIDKLLSNVRAQQSATLPTVETTPFDFRTPSKFATGFIRELSEMHKAFSRVVSERLSRELRVSVTVDLLGVDQLAYDTYVRAMPNPNILSVLALDPLPGNVVLEVSPQLGLVLVDRMLGGPGRPVPARQPTQLEQTLLGALLEHPLAAIAETYAGVIDLTPRFITSEFNPRFAHAAAPTEMVLVFSFSLVADSTGASTRGLISVCYPLTVINPIKEAMRQARWSGTNDQGGPSEAMAVHTGEAPVEMVVHTTTTQMSAAQLLGLAPGDVVALDHEADQPLIGSIEGIPLMEVGLGRRGNHLAARLERWT